MFQTYMKKNSSCMCIHSTKRIIKQVNIGVCIDSTGQLNPLLLSSAQVNPSLSYFCEVTMSKTVHVLIQRTCFNSSIVSSTFHGLSIEDIVPDGTTLDPRSLRNISDGPKDLYLFQLDNVKETFGTNKCISNEKSESQSWWLICLQFQKL